MTIIDIWREGKTVVMIGMDAPVLAISNIAIENSVCKIYCSWELLQNYEGCFPGIPIIAFAHKKCDKLITKGLSDYLYPESDEAALILYSSGTTGKSKGIILSHKAIVGNARAVIKYMAPKAEDKIAVVKSLVHSSTIVGEVMVAICSGCDLIFVKNHNNIGRTIDMIYKSKATIVCINPTILSLIIKLNRSILITKGVYLKKMYVSGAILDNNLLQTARDMLPNVHIYNVYGMTECGPRISSQELSNTYMNNSVGKAIENVFLRIRDENGNEISKCHARGLIEVNTPYQAIGYVRGSSINLTDDGWVKTNDVGFWDEEGNLYITGRYDNMINCAGHNVFPESIEELIKSINGVKDCLIVGKKDIVFGNTLRCYYSGRRNKESEIIALCRSVLLPHEIPHSVVRVNELQYSNGKVKRMQFEDYV